MPGTIEGATLSALIHQAYIETFRRHCAEGDDSLVDDEHCYAAQIRAARLSAPDAREADRRALAIAAGEFLSVQARTPATAYTVRIERDTTTRIEVDVTPMETH